MQSISISLRFLLGLALCLGVSGCKNPEEAYDGPERIPVSGKVTMDGSPLAAGTILFTPANATGKGVNPFGGQITDGDYNFPEQKSGSAGTYTVKITWMKSTGKKKKDEDTGEMLEVMDEMTAVSINGSPIAEVTLAPETNVFNFDAKSK